MNTTATAISAGRETDRNIWLNRSIAEFIKRYAPEDREKAAYFNMHFHEIVRAIYADMTTPVERALAATLNVAAIQSMPFPNTDKS